MTVPSAALFIDGDWRTPSQATIPVVSASTEQVIGEIADGLLVLVGVTHTDSAAEAETLARKVHELRILDDNRSAADLRAPILVISQFTLYADTRKGRRPSFTPAAPSAVAEPLMSKFIDTLRDRNAVVETGKFGAHMLVTSTNVGPRTIFLEV